MKHRAYIDIETTGLSRYYCEITIIGIALEKLLKTLKGVDEIYSYNGSRFDLPFIKAQLDIDLKDYFIHTDLMYDCWKQNLKGGLKAVEQKLNINRNTKGIDGFMAVKLWWDYINNNNRQSLKTLLEYNAEDIINLQTLRLKLNVE